MCVSQYMVDDIESEHSPIGPVSKGRGVALYNCIDTNQFRPIEKSGLSKWREQYGIQDEDRVLVFAGRMTRGKGIDKTRESGKVRQEIVAEIQMLQHCGNIDGEHPHEESAEMLIGDEIVQRIGRGDGFDLRLFHRFEVQSPFVAGEKVISLEIVE